MWRSWRVCGFLTLVSLALFGEPLPARSSTPKFRSSTDLVVLDVCVKDRTGRLIPGLAADDFLVVDANSPQRVEFFSTGGLAPLAVVLLLDRSGSMAGQKIERAKAAATAFIRALRPQDLLEVITFADRTDRRLPFGSDRAAAEQAVADLSANGQTALFESLAVALHDLAKLRAGETIEYQPAIVVLSDGDDTRSLIAFEDLLDDARRSGVAIYSVSLREDKNGRALGVPRELFQLSQETGGRAVAVEDPQQLAPVYEDIGAELRHLYRLAFVPANLPHDGSWRRISVRVLGNPDARVRTRAGYYAPRRSHSWGR